MSERFQVMTERPGRYDLIVKETTSNDAGEYYCKDTDIHGATLVLGRCGCLRSVILNVISGSEIGQIIMHLSSYKETTELFIYYLFIYLEIHTNMQYFKNILQYQPETSKRVVSCFIRLMNLVYEQYCCQL